MDLKNGNFDIWVARRPAADDNWGKVDEIRIELKTKVRNAYDKFILKERL